MPLVKMLLSCSIVLLALTRLTSPRPAPALNPLIHLVNKNRGPGGVVLLFQPMPPPEAFAEVIVHSFYKQQQDAQREKYEQDPDKYVNERGVRNLLPKPPFEGTPFDKLMETEPVNMYQLFNLHCLGPVMDAGKTVYGINAKVNAGEKITLPTKAHVIKRNAGLIISFPQQDEVGKFTTIFIDGQIKADNVPFDALAQARQAKNVADVDPDTQKLQKRKTPDERPEAVKEGMAQIPETKLYQTGTVIGTFTANHARVYVLRTEHPFNHSEPWNSSAETHIPLKGTLVSACRALKGCDSTMCTTSQDGTGPRVVDEQDEAAAQAVQKQNSDNKQTQPLVKYKRNK